MISGFLVVDKPPGLTSHDVVAIVRAVTGLPKVGHTGTLDPFATGVLPLALGRSTRLIQYLDESIKVYDAHIRLGSATDTGDPTGQVVREAPLPTADTVEIDRVLQTFVGERMQEPPAYSAVKIAGRPMYDYARKGETVKAAARKITLHSVERLAYDGSLLRVRITCSRGTYARVLADEIAIALGSAGHLEQLARERSGPFFLPDAVGLPAIATIVGQRDDLTWQSVLTPGRSEDRVKWRPRDEVVQGLVKWIQPELRCLSHLPIAEISPVDVQRVRQGGSLPVPPRGVGVGGRYLVVAADQLIAVAENTPRGPQGLRLV